MVSSGVSLGFSIGVSIGVSIWVSVGVSSKLSIFVSSTFFISPIVSVLSILFVVCTVNNGS